MPDRFLRGALGAFLLVLGMACSERLTGSLGCPQLCSDQSATLRDTVLTGSIAFDSVVTGFPLLGTVRDFTLLAHGDTADVRLVIRYDTLPNTYRPTGAAADSAITRVDSANLVFIVDTSAGRPTAPVTLEAFDVDTTANDTLPQTLLPLFRPDRLIGSAVFQPAEIKDTLRLPLSGPAILAKITGNKRLRLGLRLVSAQPARLRVAGSALPPRVRYRVSADTAVPPETLFVRSTTPADNQEVANVLAVYPIYARGVAPPPAQDRMAVGGINGARTFLRFDVPTTLVDSVEVVRASLILHQLPSRLPGGRADTIPVVVGPVLSGAQISDVFTASQFIGNGAAIGIPTTNFVPRDTGEKSIELVSLFQAWRSVGSANSTRAIVLRALFEASSAGEVNFVSVDGPAALRPRLRITYVPRRGFGIP